MILHWLASLCFSLRGDEARRFPLDLLGCQLLLDSNEPGHQRLVELGIDQADVGRAVPFARLILTAHSGKGLLKLPLGLEASVQNEAHALGISAEIVTS